MYYFRNFPEKRCPMLQTLIIITIITSFQSRHPGLLQLVGRWDHRQGLKSLFTQTTNGPIVNQGTHDPGSVHTESSHTGHNLQKKPLTLGASKQGDSPHCSLYAAIKPWWENGTVCGNLWHMGHGTEAGALTQHSNQWDGLLKGLSDRPARQTCIYMLTCTLTHT